MLREVSVGQDICMFSTVSLGHGAARNRGVPHGAMPRAQEAAPRPSKDAQGEQ